MIAQMAHHGYSDKDADDVPCDKHTDSGALFEQKKRDRMVEE
jgi:hypothetical protein